LEDIRDITLTPDTISVTSDGSGTSNSGTSGYSTSNNNNNNNCVNEELEISAEIIKTGIIREFGNAYAAYVINVNRKTNLKNDEKWVVLRRYSDFYSFHQNITEKYPNLTNLTLPGKRTFNNMSKGFVEQRKHLLNTYLNQLLKNSNTRPDLREQVLKFFRPGDYEKEKFQLAKTVQNSIFNPLKSSVNNVRNVVKSGSGNLIDGLQRLSRFGSVTSSNQSQSLQSSQSSFSKNSLKLNIPSETNSSSTSKESTPLENSKLLANFDTESEDNIPLRIMLLLMDEVFDLKSKNLWLRRQIVTFLRQIIQATYGDAINRKIIDYVEELTSASAISDYIRAFK
jgi:sorting nexin-13